jgi:hypothetical protein
MFPPEVAFPDQPCHAFKRRFVNSASNNTRGSLFIDSYRTSRLCLTVLGQALCKLIKKQETERISCCNVDKCCPPDWHWGELQWESSHRTNPCLVTANHHVRTANHASHQSVTTGAHKTQGTPGAKLPIVQSRPEWVKCGCTSAGPVQRCPLA